MTEQKISTLYQQQLAQIPDLTDKQKQILQASLDLFSEQGFEATSTQQIAERAGVSTGLVYKKFPNKEALLAAVLTPLFQTIQSVKDEFLTETIVSSPKNQNFEDFIRQIVHDRLTFILDNAQVLKLMVGQLLFDEKLKEYVKSVFMTNLAEFIFPVFTKFKNEGKMVNLPNDMIFQLVLSTMAGYFGRMLLDSQAPDLETEITVVTDFLQKSLRP
ncbi:TetR/AcrR family transcriptional regulator [Lactovum odontotermitis]